MVNICNGSILIIATNIKETRNFAQIFFSYYHKERESPGCGTVKLVN